MTTLRGKPVAKMDHWSIRGHKGSGGELVRVICGICVEHSGRQDLVGREMRSSEIIDINETGGYVETLNTIYRLGIEAEEHPIFGQTDDLPPGPTS